MKEYNAMDSWRLRSVEGVTWFRRIIVDTTRMNNELATLSAESSSSRVSTHNLFDIYRTQDSSKIPDSLATELPIKYRCDISGELTENASVICRCAARECSKPTARMFLMTSFKA